MQIVEDVKFLKQKSVGFDFSTDFQVLENLKKTIEVKDNAAGLAAPQIGQLKRVFVGKIDGIQFFVNPKIEKFENPFINKKEGCLSFPGKNLVLLIRSTPFLLISLKQKSNEQFGMPMMPGHL